MLRAKRILQGTARKSNAYEKTTVCHMLKQHINIAFIQPIKNRRNPTCDALHHR